MMLLSSRNYPDPASFVEDFLATLTPGVIPRADFIKWNDIDRKIARLASFVEFYSELRDRVLAGRDLVRELADSLLACDDPLPYVQCAFEILGHTGEELVTKQDDIKIAKAAQAIERGDEDSSLYLSELLRDLGFDKVLARDDLEDVLLGVQIGLETHRRKNIGGKYFKNKVKSVLDEIVQKISAWTGEDVNISEEVRIAYGDELSKKVDFVIKVDGKTRFGVEVNFYTVPGSKPTAIKRSYGEVRRGLLSAGVDLLWITDGKGYRRMRRSLRDAYVIFPNIYNLKQAEQHLADDLVAVLRAENE